MIDVKSIKKVLKDSCISCNYYIALKYGRCDNCPFVTGGFVRQQSGKILNNYGIPYGVGKPHIYYFLHYPELNWNLPNLPDVDYNGRNKNSYKHWHWVIHHEDKNHYNDNKWNLILLLNTEHNHIHMINDNPMKSKITRDKFSIITSKIQRQKVKEGTHNFITNHPMNDPEIRNGRKTKKVLKLQDWIIKLNKSVEINSQLATQFGYHDSYSIRCSIQKILNRLEIKDIILSKKDVKGPKRILWTINKTNKIKGI